MLIPILLLLVGFIVLIKSADWLVVGASALAKRYAVSDLAIGLTIVAFGTSAPELVVNVFAAVQNHQDIAYSNVIGSNIFNLFAILGIAGLITPIVVKSSTVWKEIPISFIAIVVLFILSNDFILAESHILTRVDGLVLLVLFILFLFYVYKQLKVQNEAVEIKLNVLSNWKTILLIIIGLVGLVIGGRLITINAVNIANLFNISEKVIGLTIVAVGTSLPELATSVVAAFKKNNDIAVGNIIGSNIFNIFFILGVSSTINPIVYRKDFNFDLYILSIGTLILFLAMFTGKKKKLDRWEAALLLILYIIYILFLILK